VDKAIAAVVHQVWRRVIIGLFGVLLAWTVAFGSLASWAEPLSTTLEPAGAIAEQAATNHSSPDLNDIPSEKVNQFVQAFLQVLDVIERREGELQGAETEAESLRIQRDIETEALAIIKMAGLTKSEYLQLLGLANTDSEFGERVAMQLQEVTD
jgi:hypothetical protein